MSGGGEPSLCTPDGTAPGPGPGYPAGSSVLPVLANLFMHYVFDTWPARTYPASSSAVRRPRGRGLRHRAPGPRGAGGDREADGTGGVAAAPGEDPDRLLQGRAAGAARMSILRPRWRSPPRPRGPQQEREEVGSFLLRSEGRPEENECGGAVMAAAPAHQAHHGRPRPGGQSRGPAGRSTTAFSSFCAAAPPAGASTPT